MNNNVYINSKPIDRSVVPNNDFPFITAYARYNNLINNEVSEYRDVLDIVNININKMRADATIRDESRYNRDLLYCGNINIKTGGYCKNKIQFDIWNNEPNVSEGFTQRYFNDAYDCKIYITDEKYNKLDEPYLKVFIKGENDKDFISLDEYIPRGNFTNKEGILSGKSDHTKFEILVKVYQFKYKNFDNDIFFNVCFEYKTDIPFRDYLGNTINITKLNFPCYIQVSNTDLEAEYKKIGISNGGVTKGKLDVSNIKNTFPKTMISVNKKNKRTIYDICNTYNDIYALYLEDGIYDFKIKVQDDVKYFRNVEIKRGIMEYYHKIIDSDILDIDYDTLTLLDKRIRQYQISGYVVNEYDEAIKNAEIIISQNEKLIVYCKTDEDGKYCFILNDSGLYDIRVRTDNTNIKLINGFNYDRSRSFIKQLKEQNVSFNKISLVIKR